MTTYDLPDIKNLACGTVKVRLYSTQAGLTIPTKNTFIDIGEVIEAYQDQIGTASAGTAQISFADYYADYTQGFWFQVATSDFRLRFLITEGSDTFCFYGALMQQQTVWTEHWISGGTYVRSATFSLASAEAILFATTTIAWVIECKANPIYDVTISLGSSTGQYSPNSWITLQGLFAAMLSSSGLNSGFDLTDITFVYDVSNIDIEYKQSTTVYSFVDAWFLMTYFANVSPDMTLGEYSYWETSGGDPMSLYVGHATLQDIITLLLANFGLTMRVTYNTGTDRIGLEIIQAGRASSSIVTPDGGIIDSQIFQNFVLKGDAAIGRENAGSGTVSAIAANGGLAWFSQKYSPGGSQTTPPGYVTFDYDRTLLFTRCTRPHTFWENVDYSNYVFFDTASPPSTPAIIDNILSWDYSAGSYHTQIYGTTALCASIAHYLYGKMISSILQITRTYGSLKTGGSQANSKIMMRQSIDLGLGASVFFANKITKQISQNRLIVEWIKE